MKSKKLVRKRKKIVMGIMIPCCILFIIYFGMAQYFTKHFYFGSEINAINVSGKTVEAAKAALTAELKNYTLNLKEREGKSEQIKSDEVGLKYSSDEELKKLKDGQNPFKWVLVAFNPKDTKMTGGFSYDKKLFKERIDKLSCSDSNNIIEPKNPSFKYTNNNYEIINEVMGNKIDKDALYSHVLDSILKRKNELDLESAGCYINPKYNSKSQKVKEVKGIIDKYTASKITYKFKDREEILDGSTINKWITVDDNLNVTLDERKVKNYILGLCNTYNTVGKTRNFPTSSGNTINIGGGDYGRAINVNKETQNLCAAIKEGKTIAGEPLYSQTPYSNSKDVNDIGNTYVEIDMTKQHLWFYKKGSLITEGDVVTGDLLTNTATPRGIYRLKYKEKNATLKGERYTTPVSFWMPFNGGIGMHDATWRKGQFGGNIYMTGGSHGCVNCPYDLAQAIFNNIEAGIPVICY